MAKSKFEYVKDFEQDNFLLRNCWFVVRIDGHSFSEFSAGHHFNKPNDDSALRLMTRSAQEVMSSLGGDIRLAYGQSDEYNFIFCRHSSLWNRREAKIISNTVSVFTASYVYHWPFYFPKQRLKSLPSFDGRVVCLPTDTDLIDYLSWRQVDCHINNQYNYCFWTLVEKKGKTKRDAYEALKGTFTADKNELLFSFGINYSHTPELHRKGTIVIRKDVNDVIGENNKISPLAIETENEAGKDDTKGTKGTKGSEVGTPSAAKDECVRSTEGQYLSLHMDLIGSGAPFWEKYGKRVLACKTHILNDKKEKKKRGGIVSQQMPAMAFEE